MKSKEIREVFDKMPVSDDRSKLIKYIEDIEDKNRQLAAMVAHMAQDISKLF